jgi:RNA polymerase sigma-70 factor (ECF subfamily)
VTGTLPIESFERERRRLFTVAYGLLGSSTDAEDVVQDAWLRWRDKASEVKEPAAWLTTVTSRLALDRLRSARVKRETYPGTWLPEPIVEAPSAESKLLEKSGLSLAFLFLLERLGPEERAAFVLREVFDHSYREIGDSLGKSEDACRQLVKRAKERVHSGRTREAVDREEFDRVVSGMLDAIQEGDEAKLIASLAPEAVLYGDGGGKVPSIAKPLEGRERIVRFFMGLRRKFGEYAFERVNVNGEPGILALHDGLPYAAVSYWVENGRVSQLFNVLNPDKLAGIHLAPRTR